MADCPCPCSFLNGTKEAGYEPYRTTSKNFFEYDTKALAVGESNQGIVVRRQAHITTASRARTLGFQHRGGGRITDHALRATSGPVAHPSADCPALPLASRRSLKRASGSTRSRRGRADVGRYGQHRSCRAGLTDCFVFWTASTSRPQKRPHPSAFVCVRRPVRREPFPPRFFGSTLHTAGQQLITSWEIHSDASRCARGADC